MTRKLFYVFDMVLLALMFFSLGHTMFRENFIIDTVLDVALLLRIIIPFLLYRYEKMTVWPTLVFTALFGWVIYSNAFYNTILNMGQFLYIISNPPSMTMHEYFVSPRNTIGMAIMRGIIYWIWLIPIGTYIVQYACKLMRSNGYPWYYFFGGILIKDSVVQAIKYALQSKTYAFANQNICFCKPKPMLLQTKTYAFAFQ